MATPSRPVASRSSSQNSSRVDLFDDAQSQQAGRSSTNLNAHQSAQQLRTDSRPNSRGSVGGRSTSSHTVVQKRSKLGHTPLNNVDSIPEADLAPASPSASRTESPEVMSTTSALNPSSTNDSAGSIPNSRKNSDETASGSSSSPQMRRAQIRTPAPGSHPPGSSSSRVPPSRPPPRAPEMSQRNSWASMSRLSTPLTVRDLGSDYTRYFNPFATRNNSQQDLTTPLPRYHSNADSTTQLLSSEAVSGKDLATRLSNPFEDSRRISNPFATGTNTPLRPRTASDEKEKKRATTTVMPAGTRTPQMIRDADPEKMAFLPLDDRLGNTQYALPLFTDQKEDDDDMHMPSWDDDIRLKATWRDHFSRGNIANALGLIFMVLGLLCIFVVLPVVSWSGIDLLSNEFDTPMDQMPGPWGKSQPWAHVNDVKYPLLQNIKFDLVDPDTPRDAHTIKSVNGETLKLVYSDEFNKKNRTFYHGDDPFWFGFEGWYGATGDLEWYDPDALNTGDGTLQITLDAFNSHNLNYRSGMLNSWNQLCFKGGHFEISMSLPGPAGAHGLWPGAWTLGNLGRPGYMATTDGMWPYTYNDCDTGITPNQSMTDGLSYLPGQRLPSCPCSGEDHPTPGTGRGAPEIDIAEVSGDWGGMGVGVATQSFQAAPFDIWWYPNYDFMQIPDYSLSFVNTYTGGPYQQAISTTSMLNNDWYDGKVYQKYAFEYTPGGGENSGITWLIGGEEMMSFDGRALGPNGNVGQRLVSEEPMSMVLNLGISHNWVDIQFEDLRFPTTMYIDYVRWYQAEDNEMVTCDPPGYETTEYIKNHPNAYQNPNHTHWEDAGYSWPKNTFMNGCSA